MFSFAQILKTLFEIVLFEDCSNQWSLSRPMLSLILINEQVILIGLHSLLLIQIICRICLDISVRDVKFYLIIERKSYHVVVIFPCVY